MKGRDQRWKVMRVTPGMVSKTGCRHVRRTIVVESVCRCDCARRVVQMPGRRLQAFRIFLQISCRRVSALASAESGLIRAMARKSSRKGA